MWKTFHRIVENGGDMVENHRIEGRVMLVCNPVSGSGNGPQRLAAVRQALDSANISYAAELTARRGDATRLARHAIGAGCGAVVAIGGDGTFLEVVNGIMDPTNIGTPLREGVAVGLV